LSEIITPSDTWLLIADSEKALFLRNVGDAHAPNFEVTHTLSQVNPPTSSQGTDKPGRFNDGPSVQRSVVQNTDWHELEKMRFAEDLAKQLLRLVQAEGVKRLVVAAAPAVLGDLRKFLHPDVQAVILAEVPKTLTNHPTEEAVRLAIGG
jgi:protein required for attachment to host cells